MTKHLSSHPAFVASLAVLLINDHLLKNAFENQLTGKLSDFAGIVLAPLVILGTIELIGRTPPSANMIYAATIAVGAAFTAIQLVPTAADLYREAASALWWAVDGFSGTRHNVLHVADPTDLIALSVLWMPALIALRAQRPNSVLRGPGTSFEDNVVEDASE